MQAARPSALLPVYRVDELRALETKAAQLPLMERAGLAAAEVAREMLGDRTSVLVLAGPGNNGGDAFVLARHLMQWWYRVSLVFTGDAQRLSVDARHAHDAWIVAGGRVLHEIPVDADFGLVVDGLFGIGLQRPLEGRHLELVRRMNAMRRPVLALDIPSGLNADTGHAPGEAVLATRTVTFIALKPGLLTLDGPDLCGELTVATLGLDPVAMTPSAGTTHASGAHPPAPPPRLANTHKGTYGSVGIIGGAAGMVGAALLAGRAALRLGAGRIYVGLLAPHAPLVDFGQPELMLRSAEAVPALPQLTCVVAGTGMGGSPEARAVLARCLERPLPLVLDADALNLCASVPALVELLEAREAPTVLTPHPAEAARLLKTEVAAVQSDRVSSALEIAARYGAQVVLKGKGSVLAGPDGTWHINRTGNPGLASAGQGDVLSGIVGALLAQGMDARGALTLGVHLHGAAADLLVERGTGPAGMTAGEVTDAARELLNRWSSE